MIAITDLKQKQWIKACKKLGLEVQTNKGKGSHVRVFPPVKSLRPMTIPCKTHKILSLALYRTLLEWGFTEEEIDRALK